MARLRLASSYFLVALAVALTSGPSVLARQDACTTMRFVFPCGAAVPAAFADSLFGGGNYSGSPIAWILAEGTVAEITEKTVPPPSAPAPSFPIADCGFRMGNPQWSVENKLTEVWSDGAALVLFDWPGEANEQSGPRTLSYDSTKSVAQSQAGGAWGALTSTVELVTPQRDWAQLEPGRSGAWATNESLRLAVAGPLFVFGQLGVTPSEIDPQQPQWRGKYGVGVKLKPRLVDEVQLRGGPALRSDESGLWPRGPSHDRSELFVEAVTKVGLPVVGPLSFEYTSVAVPSATASDRNQLNQDFRLARPLPRGGQFHFGAKYSIDESPSASPWLDRMQVYMGIQLKR